MKPRHTPFPWHSDRDSNGELTIWDAKSNNLLHSGSDIGRLEREFNSDLMAECPELLQKIVNELEHDVFTDAPEKLGNELRIRRMMSEAKRIFRGDLPPHPDQTVLLHFKADECREEFAGAGRTLHAAFADLERNLMDHFGPEAAFQDDPIVSDEIAHLYKDLAEVGGIYRRRDFSEPERNFDITRIR